MIILNNNLDETTMNNIKNMVDSGNINGAISQISPEMIQNFSKMFAQAQNNQQNVSNESQNTSTNSSNTSSNNFNQANNNNSSSNSSITTKPFFSKTLMEALLCAKVNAPMVFTLYRSQTFLINIFTADVAMPLDQYSNSKMQKLSIQFGSSSISMQ